MRSIQRETKIVDSKISDFPSRIQRGKIIQGRCSVSLSLNNLTLTLVEREKKATCEWDIGHLCTFSRIVFTCEPSLCHVKLNSVAASFDKKILESEEDKHEAFFISDC